MFARDRRLFPGATGAAHAPALILGPGSSHALGFVRSLGRRGIPVAVASRHGPRLRSRYSRLERCFDGDAALLSWLEAMGAHLSGRAVLLPTGDADVLFTSRHRRALEGAFRFLLPHADLVERLIDKRRQYAEATRAGVPVPVTYSPATRQELADVASIIEYPCVIKPATSHLWDGASRRRTLRSAWAKAAPIESADRLKAAFDRARADGLELIVQELVPGDETHLFSVYAYLDEQSEPLATYVLRKARQWPPGFGNGSYSAGCQEQAVVALSQLMLRRMRFRGMANVEFKRDARDGRFKLIEINCRSGNRVGLAIDSGVDLPFIAHSHLAGLPYAAGGLRDGLRWIDDLRDLAAFPHYRRHDGLTLGAWMRSAWSADSHAYLSIDDPLPFAADAWRAVRSLWRHGSGE
jgi:predicted ATP-grasp superfamily ATP-dependent carboligase